MITIRETKRLGLTVYIATIIVERHVHLQAMHVSEAAARTWIAKQLDRLQLQYRPVA